MMKKMAGGGDAGGKRCKELTALPWVACSFSALGGGGGRRLENTGTVRAREGAWKECKRGQ